MDFSGLLCEWETADKLRLNKSASWADRHDRDLCWELKASTEWMWPLEVPLKSQHDQMRKKIVCKKGSRVPQACAQCAVISTTGIQQMWHFNHSLQKDKDTFIWSNSSWASVELAEQSLISGDKTSAYAIPERTSGGGGWFACWSPCLDGGGHEWQQKGGPTQS